MSIQLVTWPWTRTFKISFQCVDLRQRRIKFVLQLTLVEVLSLNTFRTSYFTDCTINTEKLSVFDSKRNSLWTSMPEHKIFFQLELLTDRVTKTDFSYLIELKIVIDEQSLPKKSSSLSRSRHN